MINYFENLIIVKNKMHGLNLTDSALMLLVASLNNFQDSGFSMLDLNYLLDESFIIFKQVTGFEPIQSDW